MIDIILLANAIISQGVPAEDAQTLVCIAQHESKLNPKAVNHRHNSNGTIDYGLFQINSIWRGSCRYDLLDARNNLKCAIYVYNKQGLEAWSTYRRCQ